MKRPALLMTPLGQSKEGLAALSSADHAVRPELGRQGENARSRTTRSSGKPRSDASHSIRLA